MLIITWNRKGDAYRIQSYTQPKTEKFVDDENNDKSVSYRCHDID